MRIILFFTLATALIFSSLVLSDVKFERHEMLTEAESQILKQGVDGIAKAECRQEGCATLGVDQKVAATKDFGQNDPLAEHDCAIQFCFDHAMLSNLHFNTDQSASSQTVLTLYRGWRDYNAAQEPQPPRTRENTL